MAHIRDKERADKARAAYAEYSKQRDILIAQGWTRYFDKDIPVFRREIREEI